MYIHYINPTTTEQKPNLISPMNPKEEECLELESDIVGLCSPIPQPLEVSTVPAFLSKTFDIVDDPAIDAVVSWGPTGASFVVWDPAEFSRLVLPRNFKHNNFSSFVRQLNTYGFRKVDADKWEFANKAFQRGKRHLLKNIQRRKSHQSQQILSHIDPLSEEVMSLGLEIEVERLKEEKSELMKEVIELQNQQLGTASLVEGVKKRLQSAELKQKQMVSFFAKMVKNPAFISKLKQKEDGKLLGSSRSRRRFLTTQQQQQQQQQQHQQSFESEHEVIVFDDMRANQGFSYDQIGEGASSVVAEDALFKGKGTICPQEVNVGLNPDYFVSFPDDLAKEGSFLELSPTSVETMMKQEGIWDIGLGSSAGVGSDGNVFLDAQVGHEIPDLGMMSDMLGIWDFGSSQVGGGLEVNKWTAEESPFGDELEDEDCHGMPKIMDP